MRIEGLKNFTATLAKAPPKGAYFLFGGDAYLVEKALNKLITQALGDQMDDFSLQRFDGKRAIDGDHLGDAVITLPLFCARKCVVVDDWQNEHISASLLKTMDALVTDMPEGCVLVVSSTSTPPEVKRGKSLTAKSGTGALLALFEQHGHAIDLGHAAQEDLHKFVKDQCKKHGCDITRPCAQQLLTRCGSDMLLLQNETEKLCHFVQSGEITPQHIADVCITSVEASIFDLSKAFTQNDYTRAMQIIANLLYMREQPTVILSVLAGNFVDLWRAKLAARAGINAKDAAAAFGYRGREFAFTAAMTAEGRYSASFLRDALSCLSSAELALKSQRTDGRTVLERVVTTLFVLRGADKA